MESAAWREPCQQSDWSSDVTDWVTSVSNRGRGAAAGVMSGASLVRLVLQRPFPGRVVQVGGGGSLAKSLQGSGDLVRALTGGAGCDATTKGLTGISAPMIWCTGVRGGANPPLSRWFP